MRKILVGVVCVLGALLMASNLGCDNSIVTDNARSSAAGFLTGVFSSAVNSAIAGN